MRGVRLSPRVAFASLGAIDFEIIGDVQSIETIAVNLSIRERESLRTVYGDRRWRKLKGVARYV